MTISYLLGQPWLFWYYLTFRHPLSILEYWQKQVNTKFNERSCMVFHASLQVKVSQLCLGCLQMQMLYPRTVLSWYVIGLAVSLPKWKPKGKSNYIFPWSLVIVKVHLVVLRGQQQSWLWLALVRETCGYSPLYYFHISCWGCNVNCCAGQGRAWKGNKLKYSAIQIRIMHYSIVQRSVLSRP